MGSLMPALAPDLITQHLRETNSRLGFWLDTVIPEHAQGAAQLRAASPQQMAGLLSELMRAGEWLRALPAEKDAELAAELAAYRRNVERVHALLPSIHAALLQERARLEQERARIEAVAEWTRRSRQTL